MSRWTVLFSSVIPASGTRQIDKTFIKGLLTIQVQELCKSHNKCKLRQQYRKSRFSGDETAPLAVIFHHAWAARLDIFENFRSRLNRKLVACDHALSLYVCNLFSGGGHDTFLSQITCKKARIWTFLWLDRKQYGWFALFWLAKTLPSVSCCWFQSAFLLA